MHIRRAIVALATVATVAGLSGLAMPAANAAPRTGIVNCAGKVVTKPQEIVISCADDAVSITGIKWKSWTTNGAKGSGTLVWNTCLPETCVAGIVQKYPVRIVLGGLASAPGDPDIFSSVTVTFSKAAPAGLSTGTYTIDNEIA